MACPTNDSRKFATNPTKVPTITVATKPKIATKMIIISIAAYVKNWASIVVGSFPCGGM